MILSFFLLLHFHSLTKLIKRKRFYHFNSTGNSELSLDFFHFFKLTK